MALEFQEVPMSQNMSEAQKRALIEAENERLAREAEINQRDQELADKRKIESIKGGVPWVGLGVPPKVNDIPSPAKTEDPLSSIGQSSQPPSIGDTPTMQVPPSPQLQSTTHPKGDEVPVLQSPPEPSYPAQSEYANLAGNVPWVSGNPYMNLPLDQYTSKEDRLSVDVPERRDMISSNRAAAEARLTEARSNLASVPAGSETWKKYNEELKKVIEETKPILSAANSDTSNLDTIESEQDAESKRKSFEEEERRLAELRAALETSTDPSDKRRIEEGIAEIEGNRTEVPQTEADRLRSDKESVTQAERAAAAGNVIIDAANDPSNMDIPPRRAAQVEEVAGRDPTGFSKAMNWLSDILGVESKDFLRAGIYYAGSRLAGSSHAGAMNFAFGAAMAGVESRNAAMDALIRSGKYTSDSLEKFKNSKDISDLVQVANADPVTYDRQNPQYHTDSDGNVSVVYPASNSSGDFFVNSDGGIVNDPQNVSDISPADANAEALSSSLDVANKVVDNVIKMFPNYDETKAAGLRTGMGDAVESILATVGLDSGYFNDATITTILETATKAAIADEADSILKYIPSALIQYKGEDWSEAMRDSRGRMMPQDQVTLLHDKIYAQAMSDPTISGGGHDRNVIIENAMSALWTDYWNNPMDEEALREWNSNPDNEGQIRPPTIKERLNYEKSVGDSEGESAFGNWLKVNL